MRKVPGKAGVGLVEVDGHDTPLVCLDLHTAQIFLSPDDAIKLARKLIDLAHQARPDRCNWCNSVKDVVRGECEKCRKETRKLRRYYKEDPFSATKSMHHEFSTVMGYSSAEPGSPDFDKD